MIRFDEYQLVKFSDLAEDNFRSNLRNFLLQKQPELLGLFPKDIQIIIVSNMLLRARSVGVTWQSSIVKLCLFMEGFAPNLLQDRRIQHLLPKPNGKHRTIDPDQIVKHLHLELQEDDWRRIERNRCDLALYTDPSLDDAPLIYRVAAALSVVLWDKVQPSHGQAYAKRFIKQANELGFSEGDDAALAVAAWKLLYTDDTDNRWEADLFESGVSARERLEMLRCRIMLDHGRRV